MVGTWLLESPFQSGVLPAIKMCAAWVCSKSCLPMPLPNVGHLSLCLVCLKDFLMTKCLVMAISHCLSFRCHSNAPSFIWLLTHPLPFNFSKISQVQTWKLFLALCPCDSWPASSPPHAHFCYCHQLYLPRYSLFHPAFLIFSACNPLD